jgi:hypothetical protein
MTYQERTTPTPERLELAAANLARIEECAATRGHEALRTLAAMKLSEARGALADLGWTRGTP